MAGVPPANMDEYLERTLSVNVQGLRQKLIAQGLTDLLALIVKHKDFIKTTCKNIRKSSTGHANTREITDDLERNLLGLHLWCKLMYLNQRQLDYAQATLIDINMVLDWWEGFGLEDVDASSIPSYSASLNLRGWFESIENFLGNKLGHSGFPILYAANGTGQVPAGPDPGFGQPSYDTELVSRGRHDGYYWPKDNCMLWQFLYSKCHNTKCYANISAFRNDKDGYSAYQALKGVYLGGDVEMTLRQQADNTLSTIRYDGRNKNFSFQNFVERCKQAFEDMGPNDQPSGARKVEKLLNGFQYPGLSYCRGIIESNPRYKNDFDASVNYIAGQIAGLKALNGAPNQRALAALEQAPTLAAVETDKKPAAKPSKGGKKSPDKKAKRTKPKNKYNKKDPGAYVSGKVWRSMSKDEQELARQKRREAGGTPGRSISGVTTSQRTASAVNTSRVQFEDAEDEMEYEVTAPPAASLKPPPVAAAANPPAIRVAAVSQLQPTRKTQYIIDKKDNGQGTDPAKSQLLEQLAQLQKQQGASTKMLEELQKQL